jgi:hypothetical protein
LLISSISKGFKTALIAFFTQRLTATFWGIWAAQPVAALVGGQLFDQFILQENDFNDAQRANLPTTHGLEPDFHLVVYRSGGYNTGLEVTDNDMLIVHHVNHILGIKQVLQ